MPNTEILNSAMEYKTAELKDLNQVQKLLRDNRLPFEDLVTSQVHLVVALVNGHIVGCVGIEKYNQDGLLRSFAVDEKFQKQGIGNELLKRLLNEVRRENIRVLHLLTTTAENYFTKKGFVKKDRTEAPKVIKETREFSTLCPSSSIYMTFDAY